MRRKIAAFLLGMFLLPTFCLAAEDSSTAKTSLMNTQRAFVSIAKSVTPAVVNVNTTTTVHGRQMPLFNDPFFQDFFPQGSPFGNIFKEPDYKTQSLGSGVIVSSNGYVITNNHVVEGADQIKVTLADKREFTAKVVGTDPNTDVAVLKIAGTNLPTAKWGDSDALEVGDWVIAIGSPYGLNSTVTAGIVSAKGRTGVGISEYEDFIQTDAAINPGNSGGALVNIDGELVGINTAIFSQSGGYQGIGFAIPGKMVKSVMETLIKDGTIHRGWLGVLVQPVTDQIGKALQMSKPRGVLIQQLYRESPADQADLKPGDVILSMDGTAVQDPSVIRKSISLLKPGQKVTLEIYRDGKTFKKTVAIQEHPVDSTGRLVGGI